VNIQRMAVSNSGVNQRDRTKLKVPLASVVQGMPASTARNE